MRKALIVIIYVNDILIYGKSKDEIHNLIKCLKKDDIALHKMEQQKGYSGSMYKMNGTRLHYCKKVYLKG